jgi:type III restriction enzyme
MKFTLKDYQDEAVKDVLERLVKARRRWHADGDRHAFSLTATTGAGKTVMAASVFESLFFGNDDYEFEPDPGAVVIWFSDDPSLNEQSRWRLLEASDKLTYSDLISVGNSFSADKFRPGKVYFLNTQKLSKNSLLVRESSVEPEMENASGQMRLIPDARQYTIWDVVRNTIEDPDLTLYLVLDEAHRGMKEGSRSSTDSKPTIVKQLINGAGGAPGIPIVLGVSATVQRFNDAMAEMQDRDTLSNVVVSSKRVQESGLLKDTINLDIPDEIGDFSTVLLRRATTKLREISKAWDDYGRQQGDANAVLPLMVLQVPNSPDPSEIGKWLDTIFEEWPELARDCVANVFGEHKNEVLGGYTVPYIAPERVQESQWVRILIAKDAISTGWDCPRAEVMVSFRRATDKTHITQLLGRMVRTPLARRIPGNERLNSVDCLLPKFDKKSVEAVVTDLMTGESGEKLPDRRILINPQELTPNAEIPEKVWQKLTSLPSQTLPKRQARPVKRLTALAHEVANDSLLADAGKKAHAEMHAVLDRAMVRYAKEVEEARNSVMTMEGKTLKANVDTQGMSFNDFVEAADYTVIEEAYRFAARVLSPDLAKSYSEHLVNKQLAKEDPEEALMEAHTIVASIGLVPSIKHDLDTEAEKLSNHWLDTYSAKIKNLSDERQEVYRQIREMSAKPLDVDLARPSTWLQMTTIRKPDGTEELLPRLRKHLLCDEEGMLPVELNTWEENVIATEMNRDNLIAWYRNPSHASQDSLGVTYEDAGEVNIVRPDFIFFFRSPDGSIVADIVDPHGTQFSDALPKMKGLATYVENNPEVFRRVVVVAEVDKRFLAIDLSEKGARSLAMTASSIKEVYQSAAAKEYV